MTSAGVGHDETGQGDETVRGGVSQPAADVAETADAGPLERAEELIEDAKQAASAATPDTIGDPDLDSDRFPHPGDEDDQAERF